MEKPNAENLFESIKDASNGLKREDVLQLAMDEPNAYWEVLRKTDKMLVGDNYSKTVNIGSCLQHNIHGIFETGDWDVHKILKSMLWLLHHSLARRNIFVTEGRSDVFPLRYY